MNIEAYFNPYDIYYNRSIGLLLQIKYNSEFYTIYRRIISLTFNGWQLLQLLFINDARIDGETINCLPIINIIMIK